MVRRSTFVFFTGHPDVQNCHNNNGYANANDNNNNNNNNNNSKNFSSVIYLKMISSAFH